MMLMTKQRSINKRISKEILDYKLESFDTLSTEGQDSPRDTIPINSRPNRCCNNKEKLELCRKFMDQGYCPYEKKCKFAHGSHELRRNDQMNSRYKTKECGSFFRDGFCDYGNRCNFLHIKKSNSYETQTEKWETIKGDQDIRQLIEEGRPRSRMIKLF